MTTDFNDLIDEINQLKHQLRELQGDVEFLKKNFQSLGYTQEDTLVTEEELHEIQQIKDLVKAGNFDEFEELK